MLIFFFFFFQCYGEHRDLHVLTHSVPTRRLSDLARPISQGRKARNASGSARSRMRKCPGPKPSRTSAAAMPPVRIRIEAMFRRLRPGKAAAVRSFRQNRRRRSEEHTSELQSLMRISYAVFCLKKKKIQNQQEKIIAKTNN